MAVTTKAALADELGVTRSRISQYVKDGLPVRQDGKLDRDAALNWIKRTQSGVIGQDKGATRARRLVGERTSRSRPSRAVMVSRPFDLLAEAVECRLEDWHEIYVETQSEAPPDDPSTYADVAGIATMHRVRRQDVLAWLRAGCPYVTEGDWRTGEGFVLKWVWAAEWSTHAYGHLHRAGRDDLIAALGMGGW